MTEFSTIKKNLPSLGVGLGLRREVSAQTFENRERIDFLEFICENYMGAGGQTKERLEHARTDFPLISHGINLSIGSTDKLNSQYLQSLKRLLQPLNTPWWSDHLCFSSFDGAYLHELLPLPFSKDAALWVAERARIVQETMDKPFLLENISAYMRMPGGEMTEAQFITEVLERSGCGLLLDINNVFVNSSNHGFDPYEFIDQIPLERTVQIHIAGHKYVPQEGLIIDTHGAPIVQPVFKLLKYVLERTEVKAILLERDQDFPENFADLVAELDEIRSIVRETQPTMLPSQRVSGNGSQTSTWHENKAKGREHTAVIAS